MSDSHILLSLNAQCGIVRLKIVFILEPNQCWIGLCELSKVFHSLSE